MLLAPILLAAALNSWHPDIVPFWNPPDAGSAAEVPVRLRMLGCQRDCEEIEALVREYFPDTTLVEADARVTFPGGHNKTFIGFALPNGTDGTAQFEDYRSFMAMMSGAAQIFESWGHYGFLPVGRGEVERKDRNQCYLSLWRFKEVQGINRDMNAIIVLGNVASEEARTCIEQTLDMMGRSYPKKDKIFD